MIQLIKIIDKRFFEEDDKMHIDVYKTFIILAKNLSFSKTAEQLNVVQSTVSSRIVELEKHLDKNLFIRSKRSVELTDAGRVYLPYAEKIIRSEIQGLEKLKTMSLYKDKLKVCNIGSIYREKLASVVNEFYRKFPMYQLDVEFKITETQVELLLESEIDIGFLNRKPVSRKIVVKPYMDYYVTLVAPIDYPLESVISKDGLALLDIALTSSNQPLQEWFDEIMPKSYRPRLRINSTIQLLEYVKRGYGCAFLQDFLVKREIEEGRMKEIKIKGVKPLKMSSYVAINKSRLNSEAVQSFLSLIPEFDDHQYNI